MSLTSVIDNHLLEILEVYIGGRLKHLRLMSLKSGLYRSSREENIIHLLLLKEGLGRGELGDSLVR